jgi:hypothetical protein
MTATCMSAGIGRSSRSLPSWRRRPPRRPIVSATSLFLLLDEVAGSFERQFLALDAGLDEIQLELQISSPRGVQAEFLAIQRRLADAFKNLGWYTGDLDDMNAAGIAQPPGMGSGAQPHFDRHRQRVSRLRDSARDYREEAGAVLRQLSANLAR